MADENQKIHVDTDRARAGSTPGMTRYILAMSMFLLIAIYAIYLLV